MTARSSKNNTTTQATVRVWLTTPDQTNVLTRQPDIAWTRNGKTSGSTILVDEQQSYHNAPHRLSPSLARIWHTEQQELDRFSVRRDMMLSEKK